MLKIDLKKRPKNVTIVEGFPGFGLIGTITTEFLIEHLNAEKIGTIWGENIPALIAVHEGKAIDPIGIYYSKKYNLVILHALTDVKKKEWEVAEMMNQLAKMLTAKELISIEGVGMFSQGKDPGIYYYSNTSKKRWDTIKVSPLEEGIVIGVTAALLIKYRATKYSCIFAESPSNLPDSRASANVIETLDKYLGLKVDYKPLLDKAKEFETKIKTLVKKSAKAQGEKEEKDKEISYFG